MSKLTSARFIIAIMFSFTTCLLAWNGKVSIETFTAIVGMIITFYFTKTRINENPLKKPE